MGKDGAHPACRRSRHLLLLRGPGGRDGANLARGDHSVEGLVANVLALLVDQVDRRNRAHAVAIAEGPVFVLHHGDADAVVADEAANVFLGVVLDRERERAVTLGAQLIGQLLDVGERVLAVRALRREVEEQQLLAVESAEVVKNSDIAESVRAVESGDTEKLNHGSIAQQYQSKPAESPDTAGAIYDVKDYHQALGHPAKQKSGWGVIILILVIIVACAVIGAAAYFILGAGL